MKHERRFEPLGGEEIWRGRIVSVSVDRFRFADGEEVEREIVHHPGAAAVIAHDDEHVWLVRQPRETIGDPDVLEIPAGKLDVEGEPPLETARRELAEEVGLGARRWEPVLSFVTSVGVMDEVVHIFHAQDLYELSAQAEENERIEVVRWPLADIDGAIAATQDSKTLIGLMWLARQRERTQA